MCIAMCIQLRIIRPMNTQQIIQELRKLGWSQQRIAAEIQVPQPRISRWENGDGVRSGDDALALHDLLQREIGGATAQS